MPRLTKDEESINFRCRSYGFEPKTVYMVSQYESNKRAITIDALLEYSNRFNVTTDWILKGVLAPAFVEPRELYKAFGYEDVIEVYSRIKDSQMQQVALAQLRVLAEF